MYICRICGGSDVCVLATPTATSSRERQRPQNETAGTTLSQALAINYALWEVERLEWAPNVVGLHARLQTT